MRFRDIGQHKIFPAVFILSMSFPYPIDKIFYKPRKTAASYKYTLIRKEEICTSLLTSKSLKFNKVKQCIVILNLAQPAEAEPLAEAAPHAEEAALAEVVT